MQLVDVASLVKVYPDGTRAVDGVTFSVAEGEMFGFLGPNGAGKTTTIRILVTLLPATSGTASVGGHDVARAAESVRSMIGYAGQFIGVDVDLTSRENLVLQGRLHGMRSGAARARADTLLEIFALAPAADKRAATLSGGMRRRLDLAQVLVHEPPLIFLDEPTTGLDPQTRNALWEHLRELNAHGTTVFLTTQYLEEADRLCGRIAIIDQGRIVVSGTPEALKATIGGEVVTVTLTDDAGAADVERAARALGAFPGAGAPVVSERSISLPVAEAARALSDLVRRLDDANVRIATLGFSSPTLDEVFIKHTGARMRIDETHRGASSMTAGMTRRTGG